MEQYQLCCCCLELVCRKSLWREYAWMGKTEVYGDMLKECFNLSWEPKDETKDQICEVCITQIRNAVQFKQQVMQCQSTLRLQFEDGMPPLKEELLEIEVFETDGVVKIEREDDYDNQADDVFNDDVENEINNSGTGRVMKIEREDNDNQADDVLNDDDENEINNSGTRSIKEEHFEIKDGVVKDPRSNVKKKLKMSSDGGIKSRQDNDGRADFSEGCTSQNEIDEVEKRRKLQNKLRCQRYRAKKRATNLINLYADQSSKTVTPGSSTNVPYVPPIHTADLSTRSEPYITESYSDYDTPSQGNYVPQLNEPIIPNYVPNAQSILPLDVKNNTQLKTSDGGIKSRQDNDGGADFTDDGSQNEIDEVKKRRKLQNKLRCRRYRDKKRATNLINLHTDQSSKSHNSQIAGPSTRNEPYITESHPENDDDIHNDTPSQEPSKRKMVKRKTTETKTNNLSKPIKECQDKVDQKTIKYINPRQNAALILEHSTIVPFKSRVGYFNCFYCNKQFAGFDSLKTHVSELHENISYKCIVNSIHRPQDRIRADVSDINCRICKKKIDDVEFLIQHLTDDHNVKFNFDSDTKKPADCILGYDLSEGRYRCCQCKEEFTFFKTLSNHMNEHSTDHVCDVCGRCFLLADRLRAHSQSHKEKSVVKCDFCGKICGSKMLLQSHVRYKHQKLPFMCSICNIPFNTSLKRVKHLEEVHNRAPLDLTCKICSKKFGHHLNLYNHMKYHTNTKPERKFGCSVCGMKFATNTGLSNHMVVHTGEKNYECEVCHKKYGRRKTLMEHLRIHKNDRRFACGACSQAFVQKCSLKNHIRVHHGVMDYEKLIVDNKLDAK